MLLKVLVLEEFPAYKDILGNVYCSWFVVLTNFKVVLWGVQKEVLPKKEQNK